MVYALVFGLLLPVVIRMNEVLGRNIGLLPSAVAVHVVGAAFGLLLVLPFQGRAWVGAMPNAPWWAFLGGIIGTGLVALGNRAVGALGVAGFTAVNVATQLVTSGIMDQFGLFGSEVHALSLSRAFGMVLLCAGAILVVRGVIALGIGCGEAASLPFRTVEVAKVDQPTAIVEPAAGPRGLYVTEQGGRIWRIADGRTQLVLDVSGGIDAGGEKGLLGLAFHPKWPDDPRVFVNYTYREGRQLRTRVASFRLPAGGVADAASEVEVLAFDQPWSNHNSGSLAFGPDGMLYIGVGDGGSGHDPRGTGQDPSDWLGSVLRVDVSEAPYVVPADNPWVGKAGARPELWAIGLRNPWGMHFDGGVLWLADVGQDRWEEVDRIERGGNYGWNVTEATVCLTKPGCDSSAFVAPAAEYGHDLGSSVTGGFVYRGPSIPAIDGKYVYGDFASGRFWALPPQGGKAVELARTDLMPSAFGRDRDGRMYVGDYRGTIWRLE